MHRYVFPFVLVLSLMIQGRAFSMQTLPWPDTQQQFRQSSPDMAESAYLTPRVVPAVAIAHQHPVEAVSLGLNESKLSTRRPQTVKPKPALGISPSSKMQRRPIHSAAAAGSGGHLSKIAPKSTVPSSPLKIQAKAVCCLDCSTNKLLLAKNISEPLPIASITKLLTAMTVIDAMPLEDVIQVPEEVLEIPPHKVGLHPGDRLTVRDLLHGLLMESGNDCAEVLARAYPKGGRTGFMATMNRKAEALGATSTMLYTPSGLDLKIIVGKKDGHTIETTKANVASAKDVAIIAQAAFQYPLISRITSTKTCVVTTQNFVPRTYHFNSNIKLLNGNLPLVGAKTGFTNMAGRCIVALFKENGREHMVVVLNSQKHFKAAEKIYRWASKKL